MCNCWYDGFQVIDEYFHYTCHCRGKEKLVVFHNPFLGSLMENADAKNNSLMTKYRTLWLCRKRIIDRSDLK